MPVAPVSVPEALALVLGAPVLLSEPVRLRSALEPLVSAWALVVALPHPCKQPTTPRKQLLRLALRVASSET